MEPQINKELVTHQRAHAIINRVLAESQENLRQMEESFDTDSDIQAALTRLSTKNKHHFLLRNGYDAL